MDAAQAAGVDVDSSPNPTIDLSKIESNSSFLSDMQDQVEPYDLHMVDFTGSINNDNTTTTTTTNNNNNNSSSSSSKYTSYSANGQPSPSDPEGNSNSTTPSHWSYRRLEPLYEAFMCPLTKQLMRDPVTLESGQTFERSAIERYLKECEDAGKDKTCPTTGQLVTSPLKPSIALRNTIEEWISRNEQARIDIALSLVSAEASESDVLYGLKDLQVLSRRSRVLKCKIRNAGLIPLIVDRLKNGKEARLRALVTLRTLAEDDEDNKIAMGQTDLIRQAVKCLAREDAQEQEEGVALLYELSKSYAFCEKIGATNGAILFLVGLTSNESGNIRTAEFADKTLKNLEYCDNNVMQMAENGRLQPLLDRLIAGTEEVRIEMAEALAGITLTTEGKIRAGEAASRTLVDMLRSSNAPERASSLKALRSLSSLETNGRLLMEAGILSPLMRDLFVVGADMVPMKLKEVSATILANVVSASGMWENIPIDTDGNTLTSECVVHNFLHLISNTGPAIEARLLEVLTGLASKPRAVSKVVSAIKSAGATVNLIQFLEAPRPDLRIVSVKLLYMLSFHMGQELADGLRVTTRQLNTLVKLLDASGVTEEQAYAAGLLSNLPTQDIYLTRALLTEDAMPILVARIQEVKKGVVRIGSGRHTAAFQKGVVGVLSRFTYMLDDADVVRIVQEFDLTRLFTELLQTSTLEDVQRSSAQALENLSAKSKELSEVPDHLPHHSSGPKLLACLPCFRKPPPRPNLCVVHGGICSERYSFCLLEANAIGPLVACLDHRNTSLVEAAMGALSTMLMDTVDIIQGVDVLHHADAIQPILLIMQEHRTEVLRQRAVWMVERILRNADLARAISIDPSVHTSLVDAFRYGNYNAKQLAEKALKTLNKIPNFSIIYPTTR